MANFLTRLNEFCDQVDEIATQVPSEEWVRGLVTLGESRLDYVIAVLERRSQEDLRHIDLSIWSTWLNAARPEFTLPLQRLALRRQHGPLFERDKPAFEYYLKSARNYIANLLEEVNDGRRLERRREQHGLPPRTV